MLIKDKDITPCQLLLTKQDRVVNLEFLFFLFFYFSKTMGRSGDGKRNILLGWPNKKAKDFFSTIYRMFILNFLGGCYK